MEPLRELRVPMQLEVRLWGMDATGKPFFHIARTVEVSAKGARLAGVTCLMEPGAIIGVQHGHQKARFRVLWIGQNDTPEQGQIGLACLDPDKCIWADALQEIPTTDGFGQGPDILSPEPVPATPAQAEAGGDPEGERRRYPRYPCSGGVQLSKDGTGVPLLVKLADISLGGCYVETLSPLPLQTNVGLVIQIGDLEIRGRGKVRTSYPSVGNGIAFTQMSADDWLLLHQLVARLAAATPRQVTASATPAVQTDTTPPLEALLQLLEKKGVLTRDEFVAELMTTKSQTQK